MTSPKFRVALVQMEVRGGQRNWNIKHAVELMAEAAGHGAQVALLPECMDLRTQFYPSKPSLGIAVPIADLVPKTNLIFRPD